MDANEFGSYIKQIRDKFLSRPAMSEKTGLHVNTIKGYEMEGRLADIDYLAALAIETGHDFADLVNKRLKAGKFAKTVKTNHLMLQEINGTYQASKKLSLVYIPVIGSNEERYLDKSLLPKGVEHSHLELFEAGQQVELKSQILLVNTSDKVIQEGHLYLLDIGNGPVARRVQSGLAGSLLLVTDNPSIAPITVLKEQMSDITFIGRVVCAINYF
jgi:hypothetical protein